MITATYHLKVFDWTDTFVSMYVRVEILKESDKSYFVKYLQPGALGEKQGTQKWVRKHNVKIDQRPSTYAIHNIRLPYKD